ncbi:MAG: glycosyltransferase family 1 protein [Candidatus Doudnabacteria bacterium]|jgi:glycosyltransferase involved in cell wall biosynthesis
MKIAIDLRSLSSGSISGVENYTLNLLDNLLKIDKINQYTLFYNSFSNKKLGDFHYVNSKVVHSRLPNKILNIGLKIKALKLEQLAGDFDLLFMPNLNQFNIAQTAKLVITAHDLSPVLTPEFYDIKRRLWHKFLNYKKAFNRANILFAVSEHTKNDLIKVFDISADKIKVIYPGLDHNLFNPNSMEVEQRDLRNRYGLPGDFYLFLSTVEPRKNLKTLIKAFEQVDNGAYLVIAGRLGWKYRQDFDLIKKSKKNAKIKYIGYISESDKPALIKLAKALVYPSFYEGFGFQPLEAFASGTPVIASGITSLPEVVSNAGLLINPYSVDDLSFALREIVTNKDLRASLIQKGLEQAKKFTWEKTAQEVLNNFKLL